MLRHSGPGIIPSCGKMGQVLHPGSLATVEIVLKAIKPELNYLTPFAMFDQASKAVDQYPGVLQSAAAAHEVMKLQLDDIQRIVPLQPLARTKASRSDLERSTR